MVGFIRKTWWLIPPLLLILLANCGVKSDTLFESEHLRIERVTDQVFVHVSYLQTRAFGKVECNGAVFFNKGESIILDSPTNDFATRELIDWVTNKLDSRIITVIPTHFHNDCIGGIKAFEENRIPSYAHSKTIELAKRDSVFLKSRAFDETLKFRLGDKTLTIFFPGRGHTFDNIVAYFPAEKVLFGGCLIKSMGAGKGYLGDADTTAWSTTIRKILTEYEDIEVVIPGHGDTGGIELLNYTATLFDQEVNNEK